MDKRPIVLLAETDTGEYSAEAQARFDHSHALPMEQAIARLRDEVTGLHFANFGGRSRELAMVLTKLDEARMWALEWQQSRGAVAVIDKSHPAFDAILRGGEPATVTTRTTGGENGA